MTIAEQRITALAQEAHSFAKEAHDKAVSAESAVEKYLLEHLPTLQAMIAEFDELKAKLPELENILSQSGMIVNKLSSEWNDFKTKYLPVIELHFSGDVAAVSTDAAAVMEKLENAGEEEAKQAVEETKTTAAEPAEQGIGQQTVNDAIELANAQSANQQQIEASQTVADNAG